MASIKRINLFKPLFKALSDGNLTKKASLNALTSILDYGARLIVGFLVQPWMVNGLGDYFYGTWQILQRFVGYLAPASGRPTQALRWVLANALSSDDVEKKRQYVGSAIAVWLIFLPGLIILGGFFTWFVPIWIKTPGEYVWIVRVTMVVLVLNLILTNLAAIPQSVLQGQNLGYKRMGLSTLLVLAGGGLTWLAIYLKTGLIGIALAALMMTIITGFFFLQVVRSYAKWFGATRSSFSDIWKFLGISWWFLLWNAIMNVMMASDVVILGLMNSVESVTNYSLTKYVPETLISIIAIIIFGIAPGLGGIIGSGDKQRASVIRGEIMALTWLLLIALGSSLVIWNNAFLSLWVGQGHYSGYIPNLLIILVVLQFIFIRNDSNFIDLTLQLKWKVILGAIATIVSLGTAAILVGYFNLGVIGICLGTIFGRSLLSFSYPLMVGKYLDFPWYLQLKSILRPGFISVLIFIGAALLSEFVSGMSWAGIRGWIILAAFLAITFVMAILLAFFLGLSRNQRRRIFRRIKMVIS